MTDVVVAVAAAAGVTGFVVAAVVDWTDGLQRNHTSRTLELHNEYKTNTVRVLWDMYMCTLYSMNIST